MPRRRVLLMIETSLVYGREALRGINRYVVEHEPWSVYLDQRELTAAPPEWFSRWDGDGVISRWTNTDLASTLARRQIPAVDLTDIYGGFGLPHVWANHAAVSELAARHLIERGFRHFAFCGFDNQDWSERRQSGFVESLPVPRPQVSIYNSDWDSTRGPTWDQQQAALGAWLQGLPKPVGVMACNDMRGLQVLDACRRCNLAVPEEVAVIGVDNDELLCQLADPPLSSVVPNPLRVGYEAAALLDTLMRGETPVSTEIIVDPVGIVTRQSTDVLAIPDPQVAAAVRYIREHACDGISVADVLRHINATRSVLERSFRRYLNRSPQNEIRGVQLKRVKQLLAETDLALPQIAERAGFEHPEYLSVVFKRETGQTPGQYRKQTSAFPAEKGKGRRTAGR